MKIKAYIHAQHNDWEKKYEFRVWSMEMTDQDHCGPLVGTHEFEFDPPPQDVLINGAIKQYRAMQQQILAESERRRAELEQKINELLSIEYKPEMATE